MKTATRLILIFSFMASNAFADCNIWVDKAQSLTTTGHGVININFWIKLANLDASPEKVAFYGRIKPTEETEAKCRPSDPASGGSRRPRPSDCDIIDRWLDYPATRFERSNDYWQTSLTLNSDYSFAHEFEGVFYVETKSGRRYYAHAENGANFIIDTEMYGRIFHLQRSSSPLDPNLAMNTKPRSRDLNLNPSQCQ